MNPEEELAFINKLAPAAVSSQKATGVPACITLAQAILESGWGRTQLATECNNYFGIKANSAQIAAGQYKEFDTKEEEHHTLVTIKSEFATYSSIEDCFNAHSQLLNTPHYQAAMRVATDPDLFAWELGPKSTTHPDACGYSTLTAYHDRLMALVHQHKLDQYT